MHALPRFRLPTLALAGLVLAACTTAPVRTPSVVTPTIRPAPPVAACTTCGRIERIETVAASPASRSRGAVLGGVVGGVISKPVTPPPGASSSATRSFRIMVLLDNGRRLILTQPAAAGMKVGSRVRVERSRVVLLR